MSFKELLCLIPIFIPILLTVTIVLSELVYKLFKFRAKEIPYLLIGIFLLLIDIFFADYNNSAISHIIIMNIVSKAIIVFSAYNIQKEAKEKSNFKEKLKIYLKKYTYICLIFVGFVFCVLDLKNFIIKFVSFFIVIGIISLIKKIPPPSIKNE